MNARKTIALATIAALLSTTTPVVSYAGLSPEDGGHLLTVFIVSASGASSAIASYTVGQSSSQVARAKGIAQVQELERLLGSEKTKSIAVAMASGMDPDSQEFQSLEQAGEIGMQLKMEYALAYENYINSLAK